MDVMDVIKIGGEAAGPVKALSEAVKSLKDLWPSAGGKASAAQAELTQKFLAVAQVAAALQQENTTLKDRIAKLERQNSSLRKTKRERNDYVLRALMPHSHAYVAKEEAEAAKPTRLYCQPCFDNGERSLMQHDKTDWHFDVLKCPRCGALTRSPNDVKPEVRVGRVNTRFSVFDDY